MYTTLHVDSNVVREDFFYTITIGPDDTIDKLKPMDEVRRQTQNLFEPVNKTFETIKHLHALPDPVAGDVMNNYMVSVAGNDKILNNQRKNTDKSASEINKIVADMDNTIGLINKGVSFSNMSTPLLRYYITECQVIHPDVTLKIHENADELTYFKDISEQVGSRFVIIADWNQVDPLFALDCDNLPNENLRTSGRMARLLVYKMFITIYGMMEDVEKFLDCLFLRAMPYEENHAFLHPNYANESPTAHGNNNANDVFHLQRSIDALPEILNQLLEMFGDRLRLVNQIFPVDFLVKFEDQVFTINVEDTEMTVDRLNMTTSEINRTNESLKGSTERFDQDNDTAGEK